MGTLMKPVSRLYNMILCGIEFAPVNVPLQRRLQTSAATLYIIVAVFGTPIAIIVTVYLILFTYWRWLTMLYLIWALVVDRDICERGLRRFDRLSHGSFYRHLRDYYPANLYCVPDVQLDPKRNYLICYAPHGALCAGSFAAFMSGFSTLFPHHALYCASKELPFFVPFLRELVLSLGFIKASSTSMSFLLTTPGGGKALNLSVGGGSEASVSRPGQYNLVMKNRKGFVKLAIKTGVPLVPVFSFGEPDLYRQMEGPIFRKIQEAIKTLTGFTLVIPIGRGMFQYSFGMLPKRMPVTCIMGCPIEVEKVSDPSEELIDAVHQRYVEEMIRLFEEHKHTYVKNSENVKLNIL